MAGGGRLGAPSAPVWGLAAGCTPLLASPPAASLRPSPARPPYHVAPPDVEKVAVHHGAVAAPLLGHAEALRGVCRHLRGRTGRRRRMEEEEEGAACLAASPPPPGEAAARRRRSLPAGGREARRVQNVGRHRAARAAAPCPGVGWAPQGALRGWSVLRGGPGGERGSEEAARGHRALCLSAEARGKQSGRLGA